MNRNAQRLAGLAAVGILGGACLLLAQESANRMTAADNQFAMKAAQGGMAEVKLGKLAESHAENAAVKEFGQRMVSDHSKANDELKALAGRNGITLPNDIDAKDQAKFDRLEKLNGATFDKAYMTDMLADHKTDIAEFRRESESGGNPELKAWAGKTLPTLEEHLKLAEETDAKIKHEK